MVDREKLDKVIKGLECCVIHVNCAADGGCPYRSDMHEKCLETAIKDALALLKAQEPIAPIQGADDQDEDIFCCGCCGAVVGETFLGPPGETEVRDNYCPECGRKVKWE